LEELFFVLFFDEPFFEDDFDPPFLEEPFLEEPFLAARVFAAFFAEADRSADEREAEALPPFFPPFFEGPLFVFFPRPEPPGFLPPLDDAFTVAHARFSASPSETPRFS